MNYYNYFTEIEEHFVRRRGKSLTVSPLDWSLIAAWRDTGVPLHVALRGIDAAMDTYFSRQRRPTERLSNLFYCHDRVMAEYAQYLESHLGQEVPDGAEGGAAGNREPVAPPPAGPDKASVERFLGGRITEIKELIAKQPHAENSGEDLERVLSRLEEIARDVGAGRGPDLESLERDLGILDDALVSALTGRLAAGQVEEWEEEAKAELKIYRKKLPKDTYARITANYMRTRIRRHFGLGELSLFHM